MRVLSFLFIIALVLPGIAIAQELGELPTKICFEDGEIVPCPDSDDGS